MCRDVADPQQVSLGSCCVGCLLRTAIETAEVTSEGHAACLIGVLALDPPAVCLVNGQLAIGVVRGAPWSCWSRVGRA